MDQNLFPDDKGSVVLSYSEKEDRAVKRSIRQLKADIERTIGISDGIDRLIRQGKLITDPIQDENGAYRWEGYVIQEVEGVLYISGVDRRGTMYGVYELSRRMGR